MLYILRKCAAACAWTARLAQCPVAFYGDNVFHLTNFARRPAAHGRRPCAGRTPPAAPRPASLRLAVTQTVQACGGSRPVVIARKMSKAHPRSASAAARASGYCAAITSYCGVIAYRNNAKALRPRAVPRLVPLVIAPRVVAPHPPPAPLQGPYCGPFLRVSRRWRTRCCTVALLRRCAQYPH